MNKKDVLVFVANGFEDTELITTINILKREGLTFDLVSPENLHRAKGQSFAIIETKKISDINDHFNYDALFLPGGEGHKVLLESNEVLNIIKKYAEKNKILAAICAAPEVLKKANVLTNKRITSYPGFAENGHNSGKDVEIDGNIITGKDYLATPLFAFNFAKIINENKQKSN